ncbi:hypothetical protein C8J48_0796 [Desmospora activa DSM 45169]|uniref:Uncharacterized protein n=1 Tax=Desmospora activa DSM 45169 TaxID=1121389 RepID=A0A2T4Z8J8_9BACL|nr:hypothetical protein C8J48_0796 [Desmospora activa DSM 45169]
MIYFSEPFVPVEMRLNDETVGNHEFDHTVENEGV